MTKSAGGRPGPLFGGDPSDGVREATAGDRDSIAAMLSRAFANDPAILWLRPDPVERAARSLISFATAFDEETEGLRLTTAGCEAASFWRRSPGGRRQDSPRMVGAGPGVAETLSARRARLMLEAMDAHQPAGAFWYLHIAGCDPARQGSGLGALVVRAGLRSSQGLPTYLETANAANLGFYGKLGFRVTDAWALPEDGPRFWGMLRPAD